MSTSPHIKKHQDSGSCWNNSEIVWSYHHWCIDCSYQCFCIKHIDPDFGFKSQEQKCHHWQAKLCLLDSARCTRDIRSRIRPFCRLYLEVIWKQPQVSSLCPPPPTLRPVWLYLVSWWFANQLCTAITLRTDLSQVQLPWHSSFKRSNERGQKGLARLGIRTPLPPVMCAWRAGKSKRRCNDGACQALAPQTSEWQVGSFPRLDTWISADIWCAVIICHHQIERLKIWYRAWKMQRFPGRKRCAATRNTSIPSCHVSKTSECSEPCLKTSLKPLAPFMSWILRLCKHRALSAQQLAPLGCTAVAVPRRTFSSWGHKGTAISSQRAWALHIASAMSHVNSTQQSTQQSGQSSEGKKALIEHDWMPKKFDSAKIQRK